MFCDVIILLFLATSPVFTAVAIDHPGLCSKGEFQCNDGACISIDHFCDGKADCFDGGDELSCGGISNNGIVRETLHRTRRQSRCSKSQWQCRDGSCVGFDGKCDGTVDCADGSDESFALCRNNKCQSNWHRCTYGACVDGTAPCNGIQECADNSDELLPRCRNETDEVRGQFRCADGSFIPAADRCDGKPTCPDGSDESVRACADNKCPGYLFQCAYGACVDGGVDCDNIQDCADGSDESDELCNRISTGTSTRPTSPPSNICTVPPHPPNGRYTVTGAAGQSARVLSVNVTCSPGFGPAGAPSALCYEGAWSGDLPRCIRYCKLNPHPSVIYRCLLTGTDTEGTRACGALEPSGTEARPECSRPNYYSPGVLPLMRCIDGNWDSVAICQPECGRVTPTGEQLVIGGRRAKRGELPWHAGIYTKRTTPYKQICGGSLVSNTVVVSAAHCFWDDLTKKQPASKYAVALGKLYRPWNEERDVGAQKSDIKSIEIPPRFQGAAANFQEDIAVLILVSVIEYQTFIRPVCLSFDYDFDKQQLSVGSVGKVAGWGLTSETGGASPTLLVVDFPYVDINTCIANSPPTFREYINSDKFCAGYLNGTTLCQGDSGGGLAFGDRQLGVQRHFLRGLVSTAPAPDRELQCNARAYVTFTHLLAHEHLLKQYLQ